MAVTTDTNQEAGYGAGSFVTKGSNTVLRQDIVGGNAPESLTERMINVSGIPLANWEKGALNKMFNALPTGLQDIVQDLKAAGIDAAEMAKVTDQQLDGFERGRMQDISGRIDPQKRHDLESNLRAELGNLDNVRNGQHPLPENLRLEDIPAFVRNLPTDDQAAFKRYLEDRRLEEETARRAAEDPNSPENNEPEPTESALAFMAFTIGDNRAERVRNYRKSVDDEDNGPSLDQRMQDGQALYAMAEMSSSLSSFASDMRSQKLTPDQVKYYTELVDKYEEDLAKLREDQQNTQAELAVVKERIAAAKTELTTIEAGVTDTEQTLQYTYEAIDAITEARENAALVELPAAYRDFNAIGDEAARGLGIDPANAWVYKDESGQYVLMNLDFTTNEGGRTTAITDPEILKRLQEADAKIDEVRETVDFHDESLKYFRETFIPEQQQNLLTLKQQAEDLKAQIEADQSRATELQGKLDSLNTQITDIETKMAEAQLKLDYNTFLSNDDVGNRLDIIANTDRPLAERQKAAQELLDMAPENVRNHLLEKYPTVFNSEATPTQTSKAAVTAEAAPAAVGDALSGLAADKAAEGTPQTPKLEQPDPAPTNLDQRAENTSRTGLSAANDVDGPAIAYNGSLSAMYAYANLPRDIPLDKPQPVTASVDLAMTDQNKKFTSSAPSFTA